MVGRKLAKTVKEKWAGKQKGPDQWDVNGGFAGGSGRGAWALRRDAKKTSRGELREKNSLTKKKKRKEGGKKKEESKQGEKGEPRNVRTKRENTPLTGSKHTMTDTKLSKKPVRV